MNNRRYISGKAVVRPALRMGETLGVPGGSRADSRARSGELAEFFALVLLGTAVPFLLRRPQILVGSVVNFTLAASALAFHDWRKVVPLILLPGLSAAVSGFLFGPATPFLFYLLPFIWIGNAVYVFILIKGSEERRVFAWGALPPAAALKAALIFAPAYLLIKSGAVPSSLAAAMGWVQLTTALIGGAVALVLASLSYSRRA